MLMALQVVRTSSPGSRPSSFYYNEGLENKLTRVPLLGSAKSIYYQLCTRSFCMDGPANTYFSILETPHKIQSTDMALLIQSYSDSTSDTRAPYH